MGKTKTPSFTLNSFTDIFSTPSVVTSPTGVPWYETLNCQDSVDMIFEYGEKAQESFIGMGYFFKRIKDKELFRELGYDNMWIFAKELFNMNESAVSRFINLCEKFSENNNSPLLDSKFKGYSKSQLIEMITIKDEQVVEKITPDMTVKQIREVKKETIKEPTDDDIRVFFELFLSDISADEYADLKNYMIRNYGKSHSGGGNSHIDYGCSPKGIRINHSGEITWAKFVSRVYLLENLVPNCINNSIQEIKEDDLPGQMNIENDFPEYCPVNTNQEKASIDIKNCDVANKQEKIKFPEKQDVIIDGEFREVSAKDQSRLIECCCCKKQRIKADTFIFEDKAYCMNCLYDLIMAMADRGHINLTFENCEERGIVVDF